MAEMPSTDLQARIDALHNDNIERAQRIGRQGVAISPVNELLMVIDLLASREIDRDPEFALSLEEARAELLTAAEAELTMRQLGVTPQEAQNIGGFKP